jgi:hypothetical protein
MKEIAWFVGFQGFVVWLTFARLRVLCDTVESLQKISAGLGNCTQAQICSIAPILRWFNNMQTTLHVRRQLSITLLIFPLTVLVSIFSIQSSEGGNEAIGALFKGVVVGLNLMYLLAVLYIGRTLTVQLSRQN